ncbi:MAG TPA: M20/M25/M40 family metallo-hydrolase [Burkholderiaceae bacterium]|nr:M20/M25/M40 family metallo-hydrolase [Burkholderiaceae bacterium]
MLSTTAQQFVDQRWDHVIISRLSDYIRIPAKSPAFDPNWAAHGFLDRVARDALAWARIQPVRGLQAEMVTLEGRTPCVFFDAPSTRSGPPSDQTVLFYGHLDKQPEMSGWRAGLGPWQPVIQDGRLYGRGAADDGYAIYAALTAIAALDAAGAPRPRCVGLIETCEESGSIDLPAYLEHLAPRLGQVGLLIGLDSGCGDYDRLWVTTSLRGLVGGVLSVEVLNEGVHSGNASGIVPSSFRILRLLLDRIDDSKTGKLRDAAFQASVPPDRMDQARKAGAVLGDRIWQQFAWAQSAGEAQGPEEETTRPVTTDPVEAILNRSWKATLSVIGAAGLPALKEGGNVLRPGTALKLSVRLPPTVDAERAAQRLKQVLETDPPYGARVQFDLENAGSGWNAPQTAPWLKDALQRASHEAFGLEAVWMGEGGGIPFISMLGERFPRAQFVITGVLGPQSNAHGPNEFLLIDYAKKLTGVIALVTASTPF